MALAARPLSCELVCLADHGLLTERAQLLGGTVAVREWEGPSAERRAHQAGTLLVEHHALLAPSIPGTPDPANVPYVLALLDRAVDGALGHEFDAIVTAPVASAPRWAAASMPYAPPETITQPRSPRSAAISPATCAPYPVAARAPTIETECRQARRRSARGSSSSA